MGPKSLLAGFCALALGVLAPVARTAEQWRSLQTPQYTVISQLTERDTRNWASEFDSFIDSVTNLLGFTPEALPPLTVVLFARDRDFDPYRPAKPAGAAVRTVSGQFLRRETWGAIGLATAKQDEPTRRAIFHESAHWLTGADPLPQPRWYTEGIAELFSTFGVSGINVHWGDPIGKYVEELRARDPLPLREFLEQPDLVVERDAHSARYLAQSWALTHLLLLGGETGRREQLNAYLRAQRTQSSDVAFRTAFNGDYDGLQKALRAYLERPRIAYGIAPRQLVERKYIVTAAGALAVEVALGKLSLGAADAELARRHAENAQRLAPDDVASFELQAYVAERDEDTAGALRASLGAVRAGSRDAAMYVLAGDGLLGSVEARRRVNLYKQAINLNPRGPTAYARLAAALALVGEPTPQDLEFLDVGRRRYPQAGAPARAGANLGR